MRLSTELIPLVLTCTILFSGCSMSGCGDDPKHDVEFGEGEGEEVSSVTYGIYQIYKSTNVPAELGPEVETDMFDRPMREMKVYGSSVFFLEYADGTESNAMAAKISPDGLQIDGKPYERKGVLSGTPHFFKTEKVIAAYFGDRVSTYDALITVFKEQFAGGPPPTAAVADSLK